MQSNLVYINNAAAPYWFWSGFYLVGVGLAPRLTVTENRVYNLSGTIPYNGLSRWGMVIRECNMPFVCENQFYDVPISLSMERSQLGAKVSKNTFNNYDVGFQLDDFGQIGPQPSSASPNEVYDNWWSSNHGGHLDTYADRSSNFNQACVFQTRSFQPFTINTTGVGQFSGPINGLIVSSPNYTDDCPVTPPPAPPILDARTVILDFYNDTISDDENKWFIKKNLYDWVLSDTAVDLSDSVVSAFIDTVNLQPIGTLHRIGALLNAAYTDSINFDPDLDLIDSAIALNLSIDTTFHIDKNIRIVNNIFLNTFAIGDMNISSGDSTILHNMAVLCPYQDGLAVITARTMLAVIEDTINYSLGDTACVQVDTCTRLTAIDSIEGYLSGICGSTGEAYSLSSPVSGASGYKWNVSDTSLATIVGPDNLSAVTIDFCDSLNFVVLTATAFNTCSNVSRSIVIFGGPDTVGSVSGSATVCSGGVEEYTTSGSHGAASYNWSVPSGSTILGGQGSGSIVVLFGSSSGNISVSASNTCDTSNTVSLPVTVNSCRQAQQAFQLNGIRAYPNPTTGLLSLKFECADNIIYNISINDLTGKSILQIPGIAIKGVNSKDIDMNLFPKGIYFMEFTSEQKREILKIIVN